METRIETLKPQKVVFVRKTGKYMKSAEKAWGALMPFAHAHGLVKKGAPCFGICYDDPKVTDEEKIRYDACIKIDKDIKPEGEVGVQTIAGGKYAVFLLEGPYEKFETVYQFIFTNWLPKSGEALRDIPTFERYLNSPTDTKPADLKTEIYIPIE